MSTFTDHTTDLGDRLRAYAAGLRKLGAIRSDTVEEAFATVPRHRFLRSFYYRSDRITLTPGTLPPEQLLDVIYANNALFTHDGSDGDPTSSSSGPSVMARMLEALQLRPGLRVLEIGAGTGYNAALITTITGAEVTTIEAGRVAATGAAAALAELGLDDRVRVVHGDGYRGTPGSERYDRIIVTCGIAGIPTGWLDQLTDDGLILAPLAHAGVHPIVAARRPAGPAGPLNGRCVLWADFMPAAGPLRPAELVTHDPRVAIPALQVRRLPTAAPALQLPQYNDLSFFLGARDTLTSRAYLDHRDFVAAHGATALVDGDSAAWVQQTGDVLLAGAEAVTSRLCDRLADLVATWQASGQPTAAGWSTQLQPHPATAHAPLMTPTRWVPPTTPGSGQGR
ncbi:protein-L-isoaspartate O-methyltransferase family protein [Prauserella muralis]|uniref:Protein-L-isoaspartate O-methyltransferase n=1 Tax=Prauserella muralis TaxID=588067 RepID=A0A2V4ABV4_9PSEU|nr:rRNA adenine N-6-methyltransferase family protein [Prauserella muralis]PXY16579.1 hypothetical protein BAY60_35880 [Prauserella muralis]TWE11180.1 protein-L-isoaspartate(D-aspartate) O-methyltransferase [Prauserella muralis]